MHLLLNLVLIYVKCVNQTVTYIESTAASTNPVTRMCLIRPVAPQVISAPWEITEVATTPRTCLHMDNDFFPVFGFDAPNAPLLAYIYCIYPTPLLDQHRSEENLFGVSF